MSYHNLYEFDYMAGADEMEDFIDEIEDETYGGCGEDMGVDDEYEMVCIVLFLVKTVIFAMFCLVLLITFDV